MSDPMDAELSVVHRVLFDYYILYVVAQYLDMDSIRALSQTSQGFRQSAVLSPIFRVLKSLRVYLNLLGFDVTREDYWQSRPYDDAAQRPRTKKLFSFYSRPVRVMEWDEGKDPADDRAFYRTSSALRQQFGPLLSRLQEANLTIRTPTGIGATFYLPQCLTSLTISFGRRTRFDDCLSITSQLPHLTKLVFKSVRDNRAKRLRLSKIIPPQECTKLEEISICDPMPLCYTTEEFTELLRFHPRLRRLALNPNPRVTTYTTEEQLPSPGCLTALADHGPQVEHFECLLGGDVPPQKASARTVETRLEVLNMGASKQAVTYTDYIHALFGFEVRLQGEGL